ncbi:ArsR family transcriptional regulator [Plantibacter sp. Leaf171]|uniref:arsenate reductase/protein-tyrosine-phosphatase family protein n=1 Tax=unclassified Plantibacter TaxID=2624265 RepID=UPI0006FE27EC|nr:MULTISPECIES: helix-turn-helix domain-containing protein [unclassified Plantibacter]KQM15241.1 ArsR family transcriptional regulator [Plantibacter sp. Leaf1]KQQ51307.1 ArsR family transcriptional regulator [Plantibacter sp. Leaf314]KQR58385.1 ArsR family transcriptional regulator [Plantibacter sp. Leaf171]
MNIERTEAVEARAAKHAALSDPTRLQMIDLLTLGDLSPTEIRVALGTPANLLTHHLNVLESVGMITRATSEGDKRRSYVRLDPDGFEGMGPGAAASASRVVFVCSANSARSQLAAALWARKSTIPVASGGTHPAEQIAPGAIAAAARHQLALPSSAPSALATVLGVDDFVITVCDNAHEEIGVTGDLHWSIPDPVRVGTDAAFDAAYIDLERRIADLAPRLLAS